MPNTENQNPNYTLLKLIRTAISPLSGMIDTSAYFGQLIGNPILGSINALLFSKKIRNWYMKFKSNAKFKKQVIV